MSVVEIRRVIQIFFEGLAERLVFGEYIPGGFTGELRRFMEHLIDNGYITRFELRPLWTGDIRDMAIKVMFTGWGCWGHIYYYEMDLCVPSGIIGQGRS